MLFLKWLIHFVKQQNELILTNSRENLARGQNNQSVANRSMTPTVLSMRMEMDLGFPEADPARVSNDNVKEWEEERGTLMMRADDDGHDVYGDVI